MYRYFVLWEIINYSHLIYLEHAMISWLNHFQSSRNTLTRSDGELFGENYLKSISSIWKMISSWNTNEPSYHLRKDKCSSKRTRSFQVYQFPRMNYFKSEVKRVKKSLLYLQLLQWSKETNLDPLNSKRLWLELASIQEMLLQTQSKYKTVWWPSPLCKTIQITKLIHS